MLASDRRSTKDILDGDPIVSRECQRKADGGARSRIWMWTRSTVLTLAAFYVPGCGGGDKGVTEPGPPEAAPATIEITPSALSFEAIADSEQLTAVVLSADGDVIPGAAIEWSTSDASVVSVTGAGLVTSRGDGAALIRASSGEAEASIDATVERVVARFGIVEARDTINAIGDTVLFVAGTTDRNGYPIAALGAEWSALTPGILAVSSTGTAVSVGTGATLLSATSDAGSDTIEVVVRQIPATLDIAGVPDTLSVGEELSATVAAADSNGVPIAQPEVSWSSSDDLVLHVSASGLVEARMAGVAVLGAEAAGIETSRQVAVVESGGAVSVDLAPTFIIIDVGRTAGIDAWTLTANGDTVPEATPVWQSLEPHIATVDGGIVTGQAVGIARVEASVDDLADTALVVVAGQTTLISTAFAAGSPSTVVSPGDTASVALTLDLSRVSLDGDLGSVELDLRYDDALMQVDSVTSTLTGSSLVNEPEPGLVRFVFAGTEPQAAAHLTLAVIHFRVRPDAPSGSSALSLSFTRPPTDTHFVEYDAPLVVDGTIRMP